MPPPTDQSPALLPDYAGSLALLTAPTVLSTSLTLSDRANLPRTFLHTLTNLLPYHEPRNLEMMANHLVSLTHVSAYKLSATLPHRSLHWKVTTRSYCMTPSAYLAAKLTKPSWKATSPPFDSACKKCSMLMSIMQRNGPTPRLIGTLRSTPCCMWWTICSCGRSTTS